MANVRVVWQTQDQVIPAAKSFTKFRVNVGTVASVVLPITEREFVFSDVTAGTYPVTVELVSEDETQVGGSASASVVVPETATAPVPVTVTVNVV